MIMRRNGREEIQDETDIVRSDCEGGVCRSEISGGESTGLDVVSGAWHAKQTVGSAIDSGHDRPGKLLAMVELGHGG